MDQIQDLKKSIDALSKNVNALTQAIKQQEKQNSQAEQRCPVDVDLLTSEEIKELARLIESEDPRAASMEKIGDPVFDGMYSEFARLGLITRSGSGVCLMLSPMAHWAVEKHRQTEADEKRGRDREIRRSFVVPILAAVVSGLIGILGVVIGHYL